MEFAETAQVAVEQARVRMTPDERMDRRNAAKYIGRAPKTLATWQLEGKGPKSHRIGGRRFYFKADLDAFIRGDTASAAA